MSDHSEHHRNQYRAVVDPEFQSMSLGGTFVFFQNRDHGVLIKQLKKAATRFAKFTMRHCPAHDSVGQSVHTHASLASEVLESTRIDSLSTVLVAKALG